MKRVHLILTGLSITIILLSLNRLTNLTQAHLQPLQFLRWQDFNAMIPIPLLSVILYYLLKREVVYESPIRKTALFVGLNVLLISGIYLFAAGSGDHEVTNYLNHRYCYTQDLETTLCNIIRYNDDAFSHYVYYAGFVLMNAALMSMEQLMPRKKPISQKDLILIGANALFIALGIFANIAFEEATLDLVIFGSVMLFSIFMLTKRGVYRLPITFYFTVAYTLGVVSAFIYKSI